MNSTNDNLLFIDYESIRLRRISPRKYSNIKYILSAPFHNTNIYRTVPSPSNKLSPSAYLIFKVDFAGTIAKQRPNH